MFLIPLSDFVLPLMLLCTGWVVMRQAMGKQRYSLVSGNADSDATRATGNGHKPKEGAANELVPLVSRI